MDIDAIKDAPPLDFEIKNSKPVELGDLTVSLEGLAEEFKHYIAMTDPEASASEVTLYIKEIRTGSIIGALVAASPQIIQTVGYVNAIVGFAKHLKSAYDYLTGKSDEKPDLDKTSYENLTKIVEPVAKDRAAQFNLGANYGNIFLALNSADANAAQNAARREIEKLRDPGTRLHEKVVLYWYQARGEANSTAGDKGIIESISPKPLKVICANDRIKSQMVLDVENPFKEAYVVDVMVETIQGRPVLYNILAIHHKFEREGD